MLEKLQALLERIYGLPTSLSVGDFLITDPEHARALGPRKGNIAREALLLRESAEGLDITLFIHHSILSRLQTHDPFTRLGRHNLDAFCITVEGISHFLCLVWNANRRRSVTLLEMELQAEVDKYVTSLLLMALQNGGRVPRSLHHWLFGKPVLVEGLSPVDQVRYLDANRYAARYCIDLTRRFAHRQGMTGLRDELRDFYRLGKHPKLRRIDNCRHC
jgi:hypothetical protein